MPHQHFGIESLACYLHLTPQQVTRLAERGKIPAHKVGGQWRFSKAEIHLWLERKIGVSDEGELVEMEGVLRRSAEVGEPEEVSIADMLPIEAVAIPLEARTQPKVISAMVDLAAGTGLLWDPEKMIEAVRSREEMHPTALENGVALLHPRRPMASILGEPFLALGITRSGIPFGGSGGMLTDVFFLICSMEDRGHLRTLARLSRLIGAPGVLDGLRQADHADAAHALIIEMEEELFGRARQEAR